MKIVEQLIDYKDFDYVSDDVIRFYKAVLKVDVAEFPKGLKFDEVIIDFENSIIAFQNGLKQDVYQLNLSIGSKTSWNK